VRVAEARDQQRTESIVDVKPEPEAIPHSAAIEEVTKSEEAPSKRRRKSPRGASAEVEGESAAEGVRLEEILPDSPLSARVEALLMIIDRPQTEHRLAQWIGLSDRDGARRVNAAIAELNEAYERTGRAFRAERLAGGWQVLTQSEFGPLVSRLDRDRMQTRLSPSAIETLSIVAYRQPILRAEVEAIRGVACGEVLRSLLERRLIRIVGRAEELGRPILYGTSREFLKVFGLPGLEDLPMVAGMEHVVRARPQQVDGVSEEAAAAAVPGAPDDPQQGVGAGVP